MLVDTAELDVVQGKDDAQEDNDDTDREHGAAPEEKRQWLRL
jgi:hypothetical protein